MSDRVLLVIPARLESTRLPYKMLLRETGKYLVQHVYERALLVRGADRVLVAADDPAIVEAVESFGGEAVLTARNHKSGSDRVAEAAKRSTARVVVDIQGDEPDLDPGDVEALIAAMQPSVEMGTLVFDRLTQAQQEDPSVVKAVVEKGWAVDFRREPTPGGRRHLGIYAFRTDFLQIFSGMPATPREKKRRLEQMRALDHGHKVRAVSARSAGTGIDTPEDYAAFVARYGRGG